MKTIDHTSDQAENVARCISQHNARRANLALVALGVLLVGSTLASLMLGRYPITPIEAIGMLAHLGIPFDPFWTPQQETLFFQVRLPRIALALLVGASLATAGAAYQGTFQNPLVHPTFSARPKALLSVRHAPFYWAQDRLASPCQLLSFPWSPFYSSCS